MNEVSIIISGVRYDAVEGERCLDCDKDYYEAQEERFRRECLGEIKQSNGEIIIQNRLFDL